MPDLNNLFHSPKEDIFPETEHELELKILAFKKIYRALWKAQLNREELKTNFLEGKEDLSAEELANEIENHIKEPRSRDGRTAQAWNLAQTYYQECQSDNPYLMYQIWKHAQNNTTFLGFKFFTGAVKNITLSDQEILEMKYLSSKLAFLIKLELDQTIRYEIKESPPAIKVR